MSKEFGRNSLTSSHCIFRVTGFALHEHKKTDWSQWDQSGKNYQKKINKDNNNSIYIAHLKTEFAKYFDKQSKSWKPITTESLNSEGLC